MTSAEPIPGSERPTKWARIEMAVCGNCDGFIWRDTIGGPEWEHMDSDKAECEPAAREAFLERWAISGSTSGSDASDEGPEPETSESGFRIPDSGSEPDKRAARLARQKRRAKREARLRANDPRRARPS